MLVLVLVVGVSSSSGSDSDSGSSSVSSSVSISSSCSSCSGSISGSISSGVSSGVSSSSSSSSSSSGSGRVFKAQKFLANIVRFAVATMNPCRLAVVAPATCSRKHWTQTKRLRMGFQSSLEPTRTQGYGSGEGGRGERRRGGEEEGGEGGREGGREGGEGIQACPVQGAAAALAVAAVPPSGSNLKNLPMKKI